MDRARDGASGQAIVEFALASMVFFLVVFGTVDFGRAVFMHAQLHSAVRDGARYAKLHPTETTAIKNKVIAGASAFDLAASSVTVSCPGGCSGSSAQVTVTANAPFRAITQDFLGIAPITMRASATAGTE
jgi:Flp pilus assembly protein TadG